MRGPAANPSATTPASTIAAGPRGAWAARAARAAVAAVFLAAAYGKIADPGHFAQSIREYKLVPASLSHGLAIVLPWLEVFAALLLLVGPLRPEARGLLVAMLLAFTAAKLSVELRGLKISCGCFGGWLAGLEKVFEGPRGLVLNAALLALLAFDGLLPRHAGGRPGAAPIGAGPGPRPGRG